MRLPVNPCSLRRHFKLCQAGMHRRRGPHPNSIRRISGAPQRRQPLLQGGHSGARIILAAFRCPCHCLSKLRLQRLCLRCQVPQGGAVLRTRTRQGEVQVGSGRVIGPGWPLAHHAAGG